MRGFNFFSLFFNYLSVMKRIWTSVDSSLLSTKHGGATVMGVAFRAEDGSGRDIGIGDGGGGWYSFNIEGKKKKNKKKKQAYKLWNVLQFHFFPLKKSFWLNGFSLFTPKFASLSLSHWKDVIFVSLLLENQWRVRPKCIGFGAFFFFFSFKRNGLLGFVGNFFSYWFQSPFMFLTLEKRKNS